MFNNLIHRYMENIKKIIYQIKTKYWNLIEYQKWYKRNCEDGFVIIEPRSGLTLDSFDDRYFCWRDTTAPKLFTKENADLYAKKVETIIKGYNKQGNRKTKVFTDCEVMPIISWYDKEIKLAGETIEYLENITQKEISCRNIKNAE